MVAHDSRHKISFEKLQDVNSSKLQYALRKVLLEPTDDGCGQIEVKERLQKLVTKPISELRADKEFLNNISHLVGWGGLWQQSEMFHLCETHPEYKARFDALEKLRALGYEKIEKDQFGSDALSACLFTTMATPDKNKITLSGNEHITGGKIPPNTGNDPIEHIHRTFGEHLFSVGEAATEKQGHTVQKAVIASTVMLNRLERWHGHAEGTVPVINLDTDERTMLAEKPKGFLGKLLSTKPKEASFEDRIPLPKGLPEAEHAQFRKQFANPLLMPDMANAAQELRATMHHGEPQHQLG